MAIHGLQNVPATIGDHTLHDWFMYIEYLNENFRHLRRAQRLVSGHKQVKARFRESRTWMGLRNIRTWMVSFGQNERGAFAPLPNLFAFVFGRCNRRVLRRCDNRNRLAFRLARLRCERDKAHRLF